jgi:aryl-alcohol dehydrogenase-like predicted oxidoreductase
VQYRQLGRTGIRVSLLGLGTGGANQFGQRRGGGLDEARALVRTALDLGINYFDTAHAYGLSEELLGESLVGVPRSEYVLATKYTYRDPGGPLLTPASVDEAIETSRRRLRVEALDVMQIHVLKAPDVDEVLDRHLPVLVRAREQGRIRAIGVTESFAGDDPGHETLLRLLRERVTDVEVVMVGYNVLHQNAEREVLPLALEAGVGVVVMAAVRHTLRSRPELETQIAELKAAGHIAPDSVPDEDPLGWLVAGGASSVQAACYRYAAEDPAISTVLTGTFDPAHLRENAAELDAGPLPAADRHRLQAVFGHLAMGLGR